MIKATELRIGNRFIGIAGIQTVMAIEDNTQRGKYNMDQYNGYSHLILCQENQNQYKPCEIEGVQLTEEWLSKLGFKKSYQSNLTTRFDLISDTTFGYEFSSYGEAGGMHGFRHYGRYYKCDYIHQLQNLYHSMTGQELELKEG